MSRRAVLLLPLISVLCTILESICGSRMLSCKRIFRFRLLLTTCIIPNFENEVLNDVAIALGNDILNLAINGLGGNYASTEDFYDLNLGFNKMLQAADGSNTNTYGTIKVQGFLGRYLTPHKVDATGATGSDYTGENLIAVMRKVYEAMPAEFT